MRICFKVVLILQISIIPRCIRRGSLHGIVANMLDCNNVVNKFKLQLCYYAYFWTNALGKGISILIPPVIG